MTSPILKLNSPPLTSPSRFDPPLLIAIHHERNFEIQNTPSIMADIKPPFTEETARLKVKAAQNMWNTQ